jgi:hypothetical protein
MTGTSGSLFFLFLDGIPPYIEIHLLDFTTTMAVTLTVLEQEFLARSSATIAAMDPSKVKNKTMEDDSSKQYKANKNRQGRRWGL